MSRKRDKKDRFSHGGNPQLQQQHSRSTNGGGNSRSYQRNHQTTRGRGHEANANQVKADDQEMEEFQDSSVFPMYKIYDVHNVHSVSVDKPYYVNVQCNHVNVKFEIDTAASHTIIGETTYQKLLSFCTLKPCSTNLKSYTNDKIDLLGEIECAVSYNDQCINLKLIVCKGHRASLLGRNWLHHVQLNWARIFSVKNDSKLDNLLSKYTEVFSEKPGEIKGFEAEIPIKEDAIPIFKKPYFVPYPLQEKVKSQLYRDIDRGVFTKVEHSDWASPQVCVLKNDGQSIRLCGDYKVTVNQVMDKNPYVTLTG